MDAQRTLNQLEGLTLHPEGLSAQGTRARELRNTPLNQLTVEDLRVLISEQQGLPYTVPLALDILAANPDAAGSLHPGDLLGAVERVPSGFWLTQPALRRRIERIQARRFAAELGD